MAYTYDKSNSPTKPSGQNQPWHKSPSLVAGSLLGIGLLATPVITETFYNRSVISITADDLSASAFEAYPELRQQHCQTRTQQLQRGDDMLSLQFADQPEVTTSQTVNNSFALRSWCQDNLPQQPIGKQPGTSLTSTLERIIIEINKIRTQGNDHPAVVTMTLHFTEPVVGKPPQDFQQVKLLIDEITANRGTVAIIGTTGKLQNQLAMTLADNPNTRVCSQKDVATCVEWAFANAREFSE